MALNRRTYRIVDGERIEGTWRPIFIRNGRSYFLTDLLIYADGAIYCWEWVDLYGLRRKLNSGWVATAIEFGAQASAHDLASWRFAEPQMWVTAEDLLGEVADEIDQLNNRPDSMQRCLQALDQFLLSRTEEDRRALRAAYLAIPAHHRQYVLGDMDARDGPLRVLSLPVAHASMTTRSTPRILETRTTLSPMRCIRMRSNISRNLASRLSGGGPTVQLKGPTSRKIQR